MLAILACRLLTVHPHGRGEHPRPEHQSWDGLILRHDDPWWDTHYPPNGWGCKCSVRSLAERDLRKMGKAGPDQAPPIQWETRTVGKRSPVQRTVEVPKGIDPGWAYAPGKESWLVRGVEQVMEKTGAWSPDVAAHAGKMLDNNAVMAAFLNSYQAWVGAVTNKTDLPKADAVRVVGVMSPAVLKKLRELGVTVPTAALRLEARVLKHLDAIKRKGEKSLALDMILQLPIILHRPRAVLWDGVGRRPALLYVFDTGKNEKFARVVVRVDFAIKGSRINAIRSGSIVEPRAINDPRFVLLEGSL